MSQQVILNKLLCKKKLQHQKKAKLPHSIIQVYPILKMNNMMKLLLNTIKPQMMRNQVSIIITVVWLITALINLKTLRQILIVQLTEIPMIHQFTLTAEMSGLIGIHKCLRKLRPIIIQLQNLLHKVLNCGIQKVLLIKVRLSEMLSKWISLIWKILTQQLRIFKKLQTFKKIS